MDIKKDHKNAPKNKPKQAEKLAEVDLKPKTNEELNEEDPSRKNRRQATEEELNNPFHGVKLAQVLERVVEYYGWAYLAKRVNIRCFIYKPTMENSLSFLRKMDWAREFVEDIYLEMVEERGY